jgi:hypothetical protein
MRTGPLAAFERPSEHGSIIITLQDTERLDSDPKFDPDSCCSRSLTSYHGEFCSTTDKIVARR